MKSKSSKVNKIKKCLKTGLPIASIAAGVIAVCCGCDNSTCDTDKPQVPPAEKQVSPETSTPPGGMFEAPNAVVKTIEFNDNDFSWNSTRLSTAGEKKLEDFMKRLENRYDYSYKIKIDIVETDAKRKRKKAQVIFDKFSFVFSSLPGIALSTKRIIAERIARCLNEEYNFTGEKRRW